MRLWIGIACAIGCAGREAEDAPCPAEVVQVETPASGFQVVTPVVEVPPESEVQDCFFLEAPTDEATCVSSIVLAVADGTHHAAVFRDDAGEIGSVEEDCWGPRSATPLLPASDEMGWALPPGVVWRIGARDRLMIQVHGVNGATQEPGSACVAAVASFETAACEGTAEVMSFDIPNEAEGTCAFAEESRIVGAGASCGTIGLVGQTPFFEATGREDAARIDVTIPAGASVEWVRPEAEDYDITFGPQVELDGCGPNSLATLWVAPTTAGIVCR